MTVPELDRATPSHGIRVVSRRTGLNADTIRAWERRYSAVTPGRSDGGRRLYSDAEIERLLLLRRATDAGRRISDVAELSDAALRELVTSDQEAERRARHLLAAPQPAESPAAPVDAAMEAVARLDGRGLEDVLVHASRDLPVPAVLEKLLVPLLHRVGDDWRAGRLRVAHEHLTTAVVRSFLGGLRQGRQAGSDAPALVTGTPCGQPHELGALAVAVMAELEGWRAIYLGPNLPAADIAHAATTSGARVVALSLVPPADPVRLEPELRTLRRLLPAEVRIVVGGSGAPALGGVLDEIGATHLAGLGAFRDELTRVLGRA